MARYKENKYENKYKSQSDKKDSPVIIHKNEKKNAMRDSMISVILFLIGTFLIVSSLKSGGAVGNYIFHLIYIVFGWSSYLLFTIFFLFGYYLWTDKKKSFTLISVLSSLLLVFSATTLSSSLHIPAGGAVGEYLFEFLKKNFGNVLPSIVSLAIGFIAFIFLYEDRPKFMSLKEEKTKDITRESGELAFEKTEEPKKVSRNIFSEVWRILKIIFKNIFLFIKWMSLKISKAAASLFKKKEKVILPIPENINKDDDLPESNLHRELMGTLIKNENLEAEENLNRKILNVSTADTEKIEESELEKAKSKPEEERQKSIKEESKPIILDGEFISPDINILNSDSGKSSAGDSKFKMNVIQKVLDQFAIPVEMGEVTVGPSVTQFTLKPAQGVNVKKILGLKDNLQMALSATNMHIEAPIPGKPFVGIEIPNEKKSMLGLRSLLELPEFKDGPSLSLAIGKNIIGRPVISDLSKMPHLLVAGATGTGKSVTLHNLILSLLYKNSPYDLKLIILDPKRVEFTAYNSLPHLYTPIIKDAKTAIKSLNWAAQEMDRRYDVLGEYGVPNITDYNKKIFGPALEKAKKKYKEGDIVRDLPPKMPFIIIVFDEFNDFMLTYPKEITPVITSLTQKARAAGIHLILTTQRPDVKVITGTIKANIPSRIALKTTSQIDSRTILDQAGAEDLLGNGDMLYMNGSTITRVQAPFVSSEEIVGVINDVKRKYNDFIPDNINIDKIKISSSPTSGYKEMQDGGGRSSTEEPTDDEDYMSARDYVISTGKASTSALQTAFRWGYNKSARIINDLEMYGIIGPATSGRHREVLFGKETKSEVEKLEQELSEMEQNNKLE
jgi:S-DNA-T family DNA segregation ATPase FtsK/SpoIIIE